VTELSIQTSLHRPNQWIIVPLLVDGRADLRMVLDTGAPFSAISEEIRDGLLAAGLLGTAGSRLYVLRNVEIQGQPIPDLPVLVSARVAQVGAQGVLGLNFLRQFTDVHFHVPTLRLTLTRP
jgi:hypothetical protein